MDGVFQVMQTGKPELAQGLLDSALGFYNGGSRCGASISLTPLINNSPTSPMVVCYALSLELYLKLLIFIGGGKKAGRIHELGDLYMALDSSIRTQLAINCGAPEGVIGDTLEKYGKSFVEWRYSYETADLRINPQILTHTIVACHQLVRELRPDLKVPYEPERLPTPGRLVTGDPEAAAAKWFEEMTGQKIDTKPFPNAGYKVSFRPVSNYRQAK